VIDRSGTIYVASDDGTVRAFGRRGEPRYSVQAGARVRATPVVGADGALFAGTEAGDVLGIEPSGALRFKVRLGAPS
jgi:outer membrane protein assembly factor BamB